MTPRRIPLQRLAALVLLLLPIATSAASRAAEIQGYMVICEKVTCPWHKAVFQPPEGWVEDESWTQQYRAVVLFPGSNDRTKPVMYVRTHHGEADLALGPYVDVAQKRWKENVPDTSIEPLADFARAGKPTFKVYL
jgi:hypothetical protein